MSSQQWTGAPQAHPLARFVDKLADLLDEVAESNAWSMTPRELADALPRLTRARARLEAVELRVLLAADRAQVGDDVGATHTPAWWANVTGQTRPAAARALRLAADLDEGHDQVADAHATGLLSTEQARVIVDAVDALPDDLVDPGTRVEAETRLVALAEHHDPRDLRRLGARILEVLAPEVAEEHERRVLEAQERRAAASARFSLHDDGHGTCHGRFSIPTLTGAMLSKHLLALAAPRRSNAGAEDPGDVPHQRVSLPLRLGQAFVEYVETRPEASAPQAGGVAATVVVTMTMESLLGSDSPATLDTGDRISAGEARRLACEAGIVPAVLGGASAPLDLGRRRRLHTQPQRLAMALRDGGCATDGCDWPPAMCHAHHRTPWSHGGGTSVDDGVLLCPRHHTLAHDQRYQLKSSAGGKVCFSRRT